MSFFIDDEKNQKICEKCELYKHCDSPKIKVAGKGNKKILIIVDYPSREDDENNGVLEGPEGAFLQDELSKLNMDLLNDCWFVHAVRCKPANNKAPSKANITACRNFLHYEIDNLKPNKILTFGTVSLQGLIGDKASVTSLRPWVGWQIPDQIFKTWIYPNYAPKYLFMNEDDNVLYKRFVKFLSDSIHHNEKLPDYTNINVNIDNDEKTEKYLYELNKKDGEIIAIDYETTGLKPHSFEHEIACISITDSSLNTFVFTLGELDFNKIKLFRDILDNPLIYKVAQNLRMEDSWSRNILKQNVNGWYWDTMLATHVMDNRSSITGLKFQSYVNFGIIGYEKKLDKYIKSKDKSCNAKNKIFEAPLNELMIYCGYDTFFTMKLAQKQIATLDTLEAYNFFHNGMLTLNDMHENGFTIDMEYLIKQDRFLIRKLERINKQILNCDEVKKFSGENFNFNSTKDLRQLLYRDLGYEATKETDTGLESCDIEALEALDSELVDFISEYKKLEKIKNTFLAGIIRETVWDGERWVLHPFYDLHNVKSLRGSSNSPNAQNWPKRDPIAFNIIKSAFIPSKGNQLLEVDYSGAEVRVSCCYNNDEVMIKDVLDGDMHRDMAALLFFKDSVDITSEERQEVKGNFVFAQFYGSSYKGCAWNIWKSLNKNPKLKNTLQHLKRKKIRTYWDFRDHVQDISNVMWKERFCKYDAWRERIWKKYQRLGYIEYKTGFRITDHMDKKAVNNYPIQGASFHCLLWSLTKLNEYLKTYKFKSKIIGQIHDSMILDVVPDELDKLLPIIKRIMCEDIRKEWTWVTLPLKVDFEISAIDGNWSEMTKIKV